MSLQTQHWQESSSTPESLVSLLRLRALEQGSVTAFMFLRDGETAEDSLTYAELDRRARAVGALLQARGAQGQQALLLFPPGLDYIVAFFGCLYAGVVAVPAYPPHHNRNLPRVQAIARDARASFALCTQGISDVLTRQFTGTEGFESLQCFTTDEIPTGAEEHWQDPGVTSETLAFLQYTSGSTGSPKGVMLTHGNLLHNSELIHRACGTSSSSRVVSWLPPYHDMGLIGGILQPLYVGAQGILMSPTAFLQRPYRWLKVISDFQAAVSPAPNFAYELCARTVTPEDRATLDLSSWEVALNGAEPIRPETLERFAVAFGPYGFRREAFYPAYGLAEATLMVSGGTKGEPVTVKQFSRPALEQHRAVSAEGVEGHDLVGCGRGLAGQKIVIVDPESRTPCDSGEVGEIWIAGPSIAQGYFHRQEKTDSTFRAYLAGMEEGPFLRTGDLGFLTAEGELFITGRLKDLIIIHGRNLYPQDIEAAVERSHPSVRPGCGAAFAVEVGGEEKLAVVYEVDRHLKSDPETVIRAIRGTVLAECEVQPHAVVLIRMATVPKTSSGKIQRHACRRDFLNDNLNVVAASVMGTEEAPAAPRTATLTRRELLAMAPGERLERLTAEVKEMVARVVRVPAAQVDEQVPLTSYGLDSLTAIQFGTALEVAFELPVDLAVILQGPSIKGLADRILRRLEGTDGTETPLLAAAEAEEVEAPLSRGQQALWFLAHMTGDSTAYHVTNAVRIRSEVDINALHRAFQALVERHESLRTTFVSREGRPVRLIHRDLRCAFRQESSAGLSPEQLKDLMAREDSRPFDLEGGPLMRVTLFTSAPEEHVLLLSMHHIITDFWSLAVMLQELGTLYDAERAGMPAVLPPLPVRYTDYVQWQENMLTGPDGDRLWQYWQERLAGKLPPLNLPTDRVRPSVQTYRGTAQTISISRALTASLKELGTRSGTTLYMTLLAVFQVLLHRYTGQAEIPVGSPTTGRSLASLSGLVGYFVNPVVLRGNFADQVTFREYLDRVRETVLGALANQDFPFGLLVERLQPDRDPSRSPLFQAAFAYHHPFVLSNPAMLPFALGIPGARLDLGGLRLESMEPVQSMAQFDLTLTMAELDGRLEATLQYNSDLFDEGTISRMLGHFTTLMEGAVSDPDRPVVEIPMLTAPEREQVLINWNLTEQQYPEGLCIQQLFERQAERTPEAIALVAGTQRLTYGELNRRANQLANYLRNLGVGPERLVGVCMERSPEMLVALLGILKAGGAYVPLDPLYPKERIGFTLEDAQVAVLITQERLVGTLPEAHCRLLALDTAWQEIASEPETSPTSDVTPGNLAYVIYTSGSTGRPKGVAIEHRSAVTLLYWAQEVYTPEELAGVLASTSICFDLSVYELFLPLSCGGTVILSLNALELPVLPAASEVTLVNTVPSVAAELLRVDGIPASVQTVNLAGEPLPNHLAQQLYRETAVQRVYNLYGPSEDTTYSTYTLVERGAARPVHIGRPIANTRVYIVDGHGQPVPAGIPGEIYIGGDGLARGYLNRPELTAEKFIADPFCAEPGGRAYRTGDLARYLPDGNIDFLGRIDHQVKIRGFRIELGEIEAVLREHPAVAEAIVIAREDRSGDRRLVGYVVGREETPSPSELRAFLKGRLPEYMLPSALVLLEALPLTPNGKVDRSALPAPTAAGPEESGSIVAPRTETEAEVAAIWAKVLGRPTLSVEDNFFDLGGHSLLAMQVRARVQSAFGVQLAVRTLFERPTVSGMAEAVVQALLEQEDESVLAQALAEIEQLAAREP